MVFGLGNLMQGLLGNFSEQSQEQLTEQYKDFLMNGESIQVGYTLIRDAIIFTDRRLLFIDRQGATGTKTLIKSVYLMNIVDVEVETAGMGLDDAQLTCSSEDEWETKHIVHLIRIIGTPCCHNNILTCFDC